LRLYYAELPRALGKIFSIAMPQFLVADVIVATMLQRYKFFLNCARKTAIIFQKNAGYKLITPDT
jgi:hypothetical protein